MVNLNSSTFKFSEKVGLILGGKLGSSKPSQPVPNPPPSPAPSP